MRCALAVALMCWLSGVAAGADPQRVVFVSTPAPIVDASRTALQGWGIDVVAIDAASPGDRMPAAERAAAELATKHNAAAVVWLSGNAGEGALWMYDAIDHQLVTRRVDHPASIDDATAAALALSVKTLLRHSQVAPETERVITVVTRPETAPPPVVPPRAPPEERWAIAPRLGIGWRRIEGDDVSARFGLDVDWRLWGTMWARGDIGSGPDLAVEDPAFDGHLSDSQVGLGGVWRLPLGALTLAPSAMFDLHVTRLRGRLIEVDDAVSVWRVNPALRLDVSAEVALSERFRLGVYVGGSGLLRRQRYLVRGEPVLELPVFGLTTGILLVITGG